MLAGSEVESRLRRSRAGEIVFEDDAALMGARGAKRR